METGPSPQLAHAGQDASSTCPLTLPGQSLKAYLRMGSKFQNRLLVFFISSNPFSSQLCQDGLCILILISIQ